MTGPVKSKELMADEAARCYELRLTGATHRQIAAVMGLPLATVQKRLNDYMEQRVSPLAEQYRGITIDRLERLLVKAEGLMADAEDPADKLKAQEQARKVTMDLFDVHGLKSLQVEHSGIVVVTDPASLALMEEVNALKVQNQYAEGELVSGSTDMAVEGA